MRWVDRGPEPAGVAGYARQFTQGWVEHFSEGRGQPPSDSFWRDFRSLLGSQSNGICWYCERQCENDSDVGGLSPTVDHFRPRSLFPELVYAWYNWVFSCRRCNEEEKRNKWPEGGFVDPCATDISERPESCFAYDPLTGELIPQSGLPNSTRRRVWDTIDELGLNKLDIKISRMEHVQSFLNLVLGHPLGERQRFVESCMTERAEHLGSMALIVKQLQLRGDI